MNYSVAVRTRSADQDYVWVGGEIDEWWIRGWGSSLLRNQLCLLREPEPPARLLINGITGHRRDGSSSRTAIAYDLALTPDPGGVLGRADVDRLVKEFWSHRDAGQQPHRLAVLLDESLQDVASQADTTVDDLIESGNARQVETAVLAAAAKCGAPPASPTDGDELRGVQLLGCDNPAVEGLLLGVRGVAYFAALRPDASRLVDNPASIRAETGLQTGVILLVDGTDFAYPKAPAPRMGPDAGQEAEARKGIVQARLPEAQRPGQKAVLVTQAEPRPPTGPIATPPPRLHSRKRVVTALLALLLVAVVAVAVILLT